MKTKIGVMLYLTVNSKRNCKLKAIEIKTGKINGD